MRVQLPSFKVSLHMKGKQGQGALTIPLGAGLKCWCKLTCGTCKDPGIFSEFFADDTQNAEKGKKSKNVKTAASLQTHDAGDAAELIKRLLQDASQTPISSDLPKMHAKFDAAEHTLDENLFTSKNIKKKMPCALVIKVLAGGATPKTNYKFAKDLTSAETIAQVLIPLHRLVKSKEEVMTCDCGMAESNANLEMSVTIGASNITPESARVMKLCHQKHVPEEQLIECLSKSSKKRKSDILQTFKQIGGKEAAQDMEGTTFNLAAGSHALIKKHKVDLVQWGALAELTRQHIDYSRFWTQAMQLTIAEHLHSVGKEPSAKSIEKLTSDAANSADLRFRLASSFKTQLSNLLAVRSEYRSDYAMRGVKITSDEHGHTEATVSMENGEAQNFSGEISLVSAQKLKEEAEKLFSDSIGSLSASDVSYICEKAKGEKGTLFRADCEDVTLRYISTLEEVTTLPGEEFDARCARNLDTGHANSPLINKMLVPAAKAVRQGLCEQIQHGQKSYASLGFAGAAKFGDKSKDDQSADTSKLSADEAFQVVKLGMKKFSGHCFGCEMKDLAKTQLSNGIALSVSEKLSVHEQTAPTDMVDWSSTEKVKISGQALHGKHLSVSCVDAFDVKAELIANQLRKQASQQIAVQRKANPHDPHSFWKILISMSNGLTTHLAVMMSSQEAPTLKNILSIEYPVGSAEREHQQALAQHVCAHAAEQLLNCACACVVGQAQATVPCCRCPDCGECELPHHAAAITSLLDAGDADMYNVGAAFEAVHDLATACGVCGAATGFQTGASLETDYLVFDNGKAYDYNEQTKQLMPIAQGQNQPVTRDAFMNQTGFEQQNMIRHYKGQQPVLPPQPVYPQYQQNPYAMLQVQPKLRPKPSGTVTDPIVQPVVGGGTRVVQGGAPVPQPAPAPGGGAPVLQPAPAPGEGKPVLQPVPQPAPAPAPAGGKPVLQPVPQPAPAPAPAGGKPVLQPAPAPAGGGAQAPQFLPPEPSNGPQLEPYKNTPYSKLNSLGLAQPVAKRPVQQPIPLAEQIAAEVKKNPIKKQIPKTDPIEDYYANLAKNGQLPLTKAEVYGQDIGRKSAHPYEVKWRGYGQTRVLPTEKISPSQPPELIRPFEPVPLNNGKQSTPYPGGKANISYRAIQQAQDVYRETGRPPSNPNLWDMQKVTGIPPEHWIEATLPDNKQGPLTAFPDYNTPTPVNVWNANPQNDPDKLPNDPEYPGRIPNSNIKNPSAAIVQQATSFQPSPTGAFQRVKKKQEIVPKFPDGAIPVWHQPRPLAAQPSSASGVSDGSDLLFSPGHPHYKQPQGEFFPYTQNYPPPTYPIWQPPAALPSSASGGSDNSDLIFPPDHPLHPQYKQSQGVPKPPPDHSAMWDRGMMMRQEALHPNSNGLPFPNDPFRQWYPMNGVRYTGEKVSPPAELSARQTRTRFKCPFTTLSVATEAHAAAAKNDTHHGKVQLRPLNLLSNSPCYSLELSVKPGSDEYKALQAYATMSARLVCHHEAGATPFGREAKMVPFDEHYPAANKSNALNATNGALQLAAPLSAIDALKVTPTLVYTTCSQAVAAEADGRKALKKAKAGFAWAEEKAACLKFADDNGLKVNRFITDTVAEYAVK